MFTQATTTPANPRILIAGGYGVVGHALAKLISQRIPMAQLVLAGRSLEKAQMSAHGFPNAIGVAIDVMMPSPLAAIPGQIDLVVGVVNDHDDYLLKDAISRAIAYVDVTRWTGAMMQAVTVAKSMNPKAPVIFSSGWMAGVPALVANAMAKHMHKINEIEISILFALADKAGPDSVAFASQFGKPAPTLINGNWMLRPQMTDKKHVAFSDGLSAMTRSFGTPDLQTLPLSTGATTVKVAIAYDDPSTSALLAFLIKSGFWNLISGPAFAGLRKAIIYHPGPGAPHRVRVDVSGTNNKGDPVHMTRQIKDPEGQTHLTALGAILAVERILGLHPGNPVLSMVSFSDAIKDPAALIASLSEEGVVVH